MYCKQNIIEIIKNVAVLTVRYSRKTNLSENNNNKKKKKKKKKKQLYQ